MSDVKNPAEKRKIGDSGATGTAGAAAGSGGAQAPKQPVETEEFLSIVFGEHCTSIDELLKSKAGRLKVPPQEEIRNLFPWYNHKGMLNV